MHKPHEFKPVEMRTTSISVVSFCRSNSLFNRKLAVEFKLYGLSMWNLTSSCGGLGQKDEYIGIIACSPDCHLNSCSLNCSDKGLGWFRYCRRIENLNP